MSWFPTSRILGRGLRCHVTQSRFAAGLCVRLFIGLAYEARS